MTHFTLRITSDTLCAWCYIALRRLQRAITIHTKTVSSADTFTITWHPYYRWIDAPARSIPIEDRITMVNGEKAEAVKRQIARVGLGDGILFKFGGRMGSTRDSHRLIDYALRKKGAEAQSAVVEDVFFRLFEAEEDITDLNMLIACGVRAGLEERALRKYMESDEDKEEIDKEAEEGRSGVIKGVPFTEITLDGDSGGRVKVVDGAVDVEEWLEAFRELREGIVEDGTAMQGMGCA